MQMYFMSERKLYGTEIQFVAESLKHMRKSTNLIIFAVISKHLFLDNILKSQLNWFIFVVRISTFPYDLTSFTAQLKTCELECEFCFMDSVRILWSVHIETTFLLIMTW